jgi:hypothetical protein
MNLELLVDVVLQINTVNLRPPLAILIHKSKALAYCLKASIASMIFLYRKILLFEALDPCCNNVPSAIINAVG